MINIDKYLSLNIKGKIILNINFLLLFLRLLLLLLLLLILVIHQLSLSLLLCIFIISGNLSIFFIILTICFFFLLFFFFCSCILHGVLRKLEIFLFLLLSYRQIPRFGLAIRKLPFDLSWFQKVNK